MKRKQSKTANILAYAALILVGFITLVPLLYAFFGSMKTNTEIYAHPENLLPETFNLNNYKQAMESEVFNMGRMLFNSILYAGTNVVCSILTSVMAGYAYARGNFPFKKPIFTVFTATMFITMGGITVYPIFDILNLIHLEASLYSLMLVNALGVHIVYVTLIKSYISTLPKELDEAAKIDGCGVIGILFRILMPLLKPILATIVILSFQASWNAYLQPQIWTASHPEQRTLIVGIVALKNSGESAAAANLMLAGTMIALLPVMVVYIACNKYFVSGLTAGAVKG